MKKAMRIVGAIVVLALLAIQAIRPERTNPVSEPAAAITAHVPVPENVYSIFRRSCFDCHSNETNWPWYSAVAPVSWLVADDVIEGRRHLNFSEWGTYTQGRQIAKLDMIVSEVDEGEMPMWTYLLVHGDAKLTDADRDLLSTWAEATSDSLRAVGQ